MENQVTNVFAMHVNAPPFTPSSPTITSNVSQSCSSSSFEIDTPVAVQQQQHHKHNNRCRDHNHQQHEMNKQDPLRTRASSLPDHYRKRSSSNSLHLLSPPTTPVLSATTPTTPILSGSTPNSSSTSKASANSTSNGLYKTELCRSFVETGTCRYGSKCQFAHGEEELRQVPRHPRYKTEICRTFHTLGTCKYGTRCRFIHLKPGETLPGQTTNTNTTGGGATPPLPPSPSLGGVSPLSAPASPTIKASPFLNSPPMNSTQLPLNISPMLSPTQPSPTIITPLNTCASPNVTFQNSPILSPSQMNSSATGPPLDTFCADMDVCSPRSLSSSGGPKTSSEHVQRSSSRLSVFRNMT